MWGVTSGDWASRPYPQIPPKSLFFQHDLHGYPRILCFRQFARPCSFLLCAFLARMGCSTSIVSMSVPSLFQALSYSRLTSGATSVVSKAPLADRGHSFWQGLCATFAFSCLRFLCPAPKSHSRTQEKPLAMPFAICKNRVVFPCAFQVYPSLSPVSRERQMASYPSQIICKSRFRMSLAEAARSTVTKRILCPCSVTYSSMVSPTEGCSKIPSAVSYRAPLPSWERK